MNFNLRAFIVLFNVHALRERASEKTIQAELLLDWIGLEGPSSRCAGEEKGKGEGGKEQRGTGGKEGDREGQ